MIHDAGAQLRIYCISFQAPVLIVNISTPRGLGHNLMRVPSVVVDRVSGRIVEFKLAVSSTDLDRVVLRRVNEAKLSWDRFWDSLLCSQSRIGHHTNLQLYR